MYMTLEDVLLKYKKGNILKELKLIHDDDEYYELIFYEVIEELVTNEDFIKDSIIDNDIFNDSLLEAMLIETYLNNEIDLSEDIKQQILSKYNDKILEAMSSGVFICNVPVEFYKKNWQNINFYNIAKETWIDGFILTNKNMKVIQEIYHLMYEVKEKDLDKFVPNQSDDMKYFIIVGLDLSEEFLIKVIHNETSLDGNMREAFKALYHDDIIENSTLMDNKDSYIQYVFLKRLQDKLRGITDRATMLLLKI